MPHPIRNVDQPSLAAVHDMNEGALPHVNSVTRAYLGSRIGADGYFRAVYVAGRPAAFLLAMNETADYDSLNFLWFRARYSRFVYIDRVVVGPAHRRAGLGAALYTDLLAWARGRTPRLACEVNLRPSNEPSLRFHEKQGFRPVGSQDTDGGAKTVSLMIRELGE